MKDVVQRMKRLFGRGRGVCLEFSRNQCTMHAAGLTYFSLLAIVPILCLLLFSAKMCGVDDCARREINARLDALIVTVEKGQDEAIVGKLADVKVLPPEEREKKRIAALEFGKQARAVSNALFDRIARFDVGTLGWVGLLFLLWTAVSTLGMVETSFNRIWGVSRPRPFWKRAVLYVFISVVLPVLAILALSLPVLGAVKNAIGATLGASWLTRWAGDGLLWLLDAWFFRALVSLTFASLLFAFFFKALPNCRVRLLPALGGGGVTALLFWGWMKVCAVAQVGIANSSALYGSFAFFPIVLAWTYMSWQIVLFGATLVRAADAKEGDA
jgi:YihY family inner membrane protein